VPFTIAQLTDLHVGAPWGDESESAVAKAVAAVSRVLGRAADAVIISGDIANTPADAEYERARSLLDGLGSPLYVLPGNHDDRDGLRRHFDLPETNATHLSYAAQLGPVRLVALDSVRDGESGGQVDAPRLAWLESALAEDRTTPTLLAMHHPPLQIGQRGMDAIGIPEQERRALGKIVAGNPQVHRIVSGHVHRAVIGDLHGTPVLALPSTDVQLVLELESDAARFMPETPSFALHLLVDGRIVSHLQPIP
jgi:3',5'-cyclic AMP phosphodiesterase CpdA